MNIRAIIVSRLGILYFAGLIFGIVVIVKIVSIQNIKKEKWETIATNLKNNTVVIEANRGNILADDGSVLATSIPAFFVRIDLAAEGVKKVYEKESDSLAYMLSTFFKDKSKSEYKKRLDEAYAKGNRGFMITPRKIDYNELLTVRTFPILCRGKLGGGRIEEQENRRILPMGKLAARTIGTLNKGAYGGIHGNIGYTGLEGSCENDLKGIEGIGFKQNLSGRWVSRTEIEPRDGRDIYTTIDVRYQDIATSALEKQLVESNADWGTAILMEVKTGEIKAVANLGRVSQGIYDETYNYAFGAAGCYEPGSTFKLVSALIALDHGVIDTSDVIDTGNGTWKYKGRTIYDSDYRYGGHGKMTFKKVFEKSSNVGFARAITNCYEKNPREFTSRLQNLGIAEPLGIELNGEGKPYFKSPGDKDWWGTSLAWMSYGYEMKMTPAQTLNLYNAIANDGKMVKPRLIKSISDKGKVIKKTKVEVINPMIVSKETVKKAQALLEAVCETGTGKSIQGKMFKVAGKTGTAQIAAGSSGYGKGLYLASFAGYFPADAPKYSMIVVINNPRGAYYGGAVAGPVFKEISERVFALYTKNNGDHNNDETEEIFEPAKMPDIKSGFAGDLSKVLDRFKIEADMPKAPQVMAKVESADEKIILKEYKTETGKVPDVRGMAPNDAVYLLENSGLNVRISGVGKVKSQSLTPGANYKQGQSITIILG